MRCSTFARFRFALLLELGCIVLMANCAFSQSDQPLPPAKPFIAEKAPTPSHWVIDLKYGEALSTDVRATAGLLLGRRLSRSENRKSAGLKMESNSYEGGVLQDVWWVGSAKVLKDPNSSKPTVQVQNIGVGDFPEFFWINNATYKGREMVSGVECDVFQSEVFPLQLSNPALYRVEEAQSAKSVDLGAKVSVTGYIRVSDKLPLRMSVGKDVRDYTYLELSGAPLVMPPEYANIIAELDARYRARNKPSSKP